MNKSELLSRVQEANASLIDAVVTLTEDQGTQPGFNPQWSVKDALSHIVAWDKEGIGWLSEIGQGTWKPVALDDPFIKAFNDRAVEARRSRSFREVLDELVTVNGEMEKAILSLADEIEESSPTYKVVKGVAIQHIHHHAGQITEWKKGLDRAQAAN